MLYYILHLPENDKLIRENKITMKLPSNIKIKEQI
jgi:hypothetical protein